MSQNPNGPNYNPYGPNPNPNQPNANYPGTAYGSPQPPSGSNPNYSAPAYPPANPPSGSNPNYSAPAYPPANPPSGPNPGYSAGSNPNYPASAYPPSNPPSGPNPNTPNSGGSVAGNPNTPNSSYGPYGNLYAPPPPTPGPYTDAPANPYDLYSKTSMSEHPISGPSYPIYSPAPGIGSPLEQTPPPVSAPPSTPPKRSRLGLIITLVVLIILIIGGTLGLVTYNNNQNTLHANATATAITSNAATAEAVGTASAAATAAAIANTYPFSSKLVLSDPMVDNSKGVEWDNSQSTGCYFAGSAYHVVEAKSNFYNTCAALGTNYTNFTFQTEMVIKSGGDSPGGGLIFRADENGNKYYRLSIDTNGNYFVLVIVDSTGTGTNGNARQLAQGTATSFATGVGSTNVLAIVAKGDTFTFYVNNQKVATFPPDSTYGHGQIGFDADYGTSSTELLFTNTKVWELPS